MSHARTQGTQPRVVVRGSHSSPFSGAAVVHREIARHLPQELTNFDVDDRFVTHQSLVSRFLERPAGERPIITISTATPTPLFCGGEVIPIVYDVRWRWTRGVAARMYRGGDLRASIRRSPSVLTISNTVKEQLRALFRLDDDRVNVIDLGPGQFEGLTPPPIEGRDPTVLLIGDAPHKRNELAAELLSQSSSIRQRFRVVTVSVSDATQSILAASFPASRLTRLTSISTTQLAATFGSASAYLALTVSEGFGFPYVEAAYMGCDVIAPRQAITTELLGEDACLLATSTPTPDELLVALESWDAARIERLQTRATSRTWDTTARQVAHVVRDVARAM